MTTFPLISPDAAPSAQEVFDASARWLLSMAEPCSAPLKYDDGGFISSGDYCCYRSEDGTSACAVGVFLPDDLARRVDAEGELAVDDVVDQFRDAPAWFPIHLNLLKDLQRAHDVAFGERDKALAGIATKYGLQFSAPEQSQ